MILALLSMGWTYTINLSINLVNIYNPKGKAMLTEKLLKLGLSDSALKGKVAVISGAGRGIGKELAIALSRLGAGVVIAELSDNGADVEASIKSEGGSPSS